MNIAVLSQGQNRKVKISSLRRNKIHVLLEVGFRLDFTSTRLSWSLALNVYWISFPFLLKDFVSSRRIFLISGSCSSAASALDLLIPSVELATCFENYSNNAFVIFSQKSRGEILYLFLQPTQWNY